MPCSGCSAFSPQPKDRENLSNSVMTENFKSYVGRRIQVCEFVILERLTPALVFPPFQ